MAIGKHRSNKRSSGNSYTSTVITVVFIAVCIIGAWMFTSNSIVSPPKNTRTTIFDHLTSESGDIPLKFPTTPAFEDNPGDLPNDAIKTDENQDPNEERNSQSEDQNSSEEDNLTVSTGNEEETVGSNDTNEPNDTNENNDNHEAGNDNNEEHKQDLEGENDNKDPEQKAAIVEENPHGLKGKVSAEEEEKLQEHHIQISEESDMTHQQVQELIKIDDHDQNEPIEKNPESGGDQESNSEKQEKDLESSTSSDKMEEENQTDNNQSGEGTGTTEDVKDHLSDEEQETRIENQQQQEEDQSQGGETSEEQVQHDEDAPIESHSIAKETIAQLESIEGQNSENQDIQEKKEENSKNNNSSGESFAIGESSSEIPKESKESKKAWSTQADQSENQKEREGQGEGSTMEGQDDGSIYGYTWVLCNEKAGADFIPCLDNEKAIAKLHGRNHYEHRERHCPEESPTCLVPLPQGYKTPIEWPQSRDKIWYHNVPHTTLADVKGHQNWVKLAGEFLTFPGGGTQFIHGALHYIDFVQEAVPEIAWGKHTRVVLDVGCGVASFGGYLFDRGVLTMSLAPKDEHEAQVQFALERGIPAISAVMGTQRLQFPSRVFDLIHCARCRVPWHREGGKLLLELNRLLRPGGYFVWSATPVYQTLEEDVKIWKGRNREFSKQLYI